MGQHFQRRNMVEQFVIDRRQTPDRAGPDHGQYPCACVGHPVSFSDQPDAHGRAANYRHLQAANLAPRQTVYPNSAPFKPEDKQKTSPDCQKIVSAGARVIRARFRRRQTRNCPDASKSSKSLKSPCCKPVSRPSPPDQSQKRAFCEMYGFCIAPNVRDDCREDRFGQMI